jgi:hypothetical protein
LAFLTAFVAAESVDALRPDGTRRIIATTRRRSVFS